MAWPTDQGRAEFSQYPNDPDREALMFWISRLEPLVRCENEDEIIIVIANRAGVEDDVVYAGTSAVIGIQGGEVRIYGLLGRSQKELLVVDTDKEPYGKLIYRPE